MKATFVVIPYVWICSLGCTNNGSSPPQTEELSCCTVGETRCLNGDVQQCIPDSACNTWKSVSSCPTKSCQNNISCAETRGALSQLTLTPQSRITQLEVLVDGTIIALGHFMNYLDLGSGPSAVNKSGLFIARLTQTAQVEWVRYMTVPSSSFRDRGRILLSEAEDAIYVQSQCDPYGDPCVFEREQQAFSPGDVFVARYSIEGTLEWIVPVRGVALPLGLFPMPDGIVRVALRAYEITYVDTPSPTVVDRGIAAVDLRPNGSRLNKANFLLTEDVFDESEIDIVDTALLNDGSLVLAGSYSDDVVLGADPKGELTLTNTFTDTHGFVARFHEDGQLAWANAVVDSPYASVNVVKVRQDGSILTNGTFAKGGTFETAAGSYPIPVTTERGSMAFFALYAPDGALQWSRPVTFTTTAQIPIYAAGIVPTYIGLRPNGTFVAHSSVSANLSPVLNPGLASEFSIDEPLSILVGYDADGYATWATQTTGPSTSRVFTYALTTQPDGSILSSGQLRGTGTFVGTDGNEESFFAPGEPPEFSGFLAKYWW